MVKSPKLTLDQAIALFQLTVSMTSQGKWKDIDGKPIVEKDGNGQLTIKIDKDGKPLEWDKHNTEHVMERYSEVAGVILDYLHECYC